MAPNTYTKGVLLAFVEEKVGPVPETPKIKVRNPKIKARIRQAHSDCCAVAFRAAKIS
jgi:hypothetical protein